MRFILLWAATALFWRRLSLYITSTMPEHTVESTKGITNLVSVVLITCGGLVYEHDVAVAMCIVCSSSVAVCSWLVTLSACKCHFHTKHVVWHCLVLLLILCSIVILLLQCNLFRPAIIDEKRGNQSICVSLLHKELWTWFFVAQEWWFIVKAI